MQAALAHIHHRENQQRPVIVVQSADIAIIEQAMSTLGQALLNLKSGQPNQERVDRLCDEAQQTLQLLKRWK